MYSCGKDNTEFLIEPSCDLDTYLDQVVKVYQNDLYTFVLYMIHHPQDAEDIVQNTFVNAFQALRNFSPAEMQMLRPRAWLFTIAHNLTINYINRYKSRQSQWVPFDSVEEKEFLEEAGLCSSPEVEAEDKEDHDELYTCIRQLSKTLRVPVVLHYIVGLQYREIADILNQSLNTVKSDGHRGFKRLQKMMVGQKYVQEVK